MADNLNLRMTQVCAQRADHRRVKEASDAGRLKQAVARYKLWLVDNMEKQISGIPDFAFSFEQEMSGVETEVLEWLDELGINVKPQTIFGTVKTNCWLIVY